MEVYQLGEMDLLPLLSEETANGLYRLSFDTERQLDAALMGECSQG